MYWYKRWKCLIFRSLKSKLILRLCIRLSFVRLFILINYEWLFFIMKYFTKSVANLWTFRWFTLKFTSLVKGTTRRPPSHPKYSFKIWDRAGFETWLQLVSVISTLKQILECSLFGASSQSTVLCSHDFQVNTIWWYKTSLKFPAFAVFEP